MTTYRTWVEIDERALLSNIETLRSLLSEETHLCGVVKANAYGHGIKEVVQILARSGVDAFGVDNIDEALFVRSLHPSALILVLGYTLPERLQDASQQNIDLTVYDLEIIKRLEEESTKLAKQVNIHLKIETGTSRQGIVQQEYRQFFEEIKKSKHLILKGLSTHFANIEDVTDTSYPTHQFQRFQEAIIEARTSNLTPTYTHCACSAAVILYPDTHGNLVRSGIALYGIWPSPIVETTTRQHGIPCRLNPVLTWKTRIAQVKSLPAGTPIGYGLTEILSRQSRVAVLPVGYSDGYDRSLSSKGEVLIQGQRCKILGRICMNMMMVDVSTVPNTETGQEVVLIGRSGRHEVTAVNLAKQADTIPYEILSRINPNLPRIVTRL